MLADLQKQVTCMTVQFSPPILGILDGYVQITLGHTMISLLVVVGSYAGQSDMLFFCSKLVLDG